MKMSRSELKALVKECLVEILQDGLGSELSEQPIPRRSVVETVQRRQIPRQQQKTAQQRNTALDQRVGGQTGGMAASLKEAIKRESGGNSVFADILADTARTTLPAQMAVDRSSGGMGGGIPSQPVNPGAFEQIVANNAPEEIFGEDVTSKWANLAFMNMPGKK